MNAFSQFVTTLIGALIGVAIGAGFAKRSRSYWLRAICMALAVAFTLPIYGYLLAGRQYGLLLLPLLGGFLGGAGWWLGGVFESGLAGRKRND